MKSSAETLEALGFVVCEDASQAAFKISAKQGRLFPDFKFKTMNIESIIGLLVTAFLLVYLGYALLRPEKF